MSELIVQAAIALTGITTAWLAQDPRTHVRRWSCLIGLAGQPWWLWSALQAHQWGIAALTLGYTAAYLRGVRVYWVGR